MNKYEILYIIRCDIEDDRKTQVVESTMRSPKNSELWNPPTCGV